jgi:pimeloyl-ACP methyl ester carboxylesterase
LLLGGAVPLAAQEARVQGAIELTPCQLPLHEGEAWCGEYEVWEDREAEAGRRITLRIGVLRAESPDPLADPVFVFNGGPGGAATELAAYVADDLGEVRARRHIVMVDRRGTGESNGLFVIREGHHNFGYEECGRRHVAEFIDNLDPGSLEESCTAQMKRPPFLVPER